MENCGNCKFYKSDAKALNQQGACKRNPPVPMVLPAPGGAQILALYASVGPTDWCGEHQELTRVAPCPVCKRFTPATDTDCVCGVK